jgi:GNAT superfamily N-acetyltransferase
LRPLRADAAWFAAPADRRVAGELQAFYEANPEYWHLTHGHAPGPDEALHGLDARPPEDMPYGELPMWVIRDRASDAIIGEVDVATDLLAGGVVHLGFFIVATARHGSGFAAEVYASYEAWAIEGGARWLRLGVVAANPRAASFWRAQGYIEVRRRQGYVLGECTHELIVMVKAVGSNTLTDYLAVVLRDRPET